MANYGALPHAAIEIATWVNVPPLLEGEKNSDTRTTGDAHSVLAQTQIVDCTSTGSLV